MAATIAVQNAHPGLALQAAGAATEGQETRFGIPISALFSVTTTMTSTGAVDSMHSSYTGLGGGVLLLNMLLGEIAPGGTGSGLYGMLILAIITVFVAGLMVGRTPTYLGKRIGGTEMKFAAGYLLVTPAVVLLGTASALLVPSAREAVLNSGPHALSEIVYAFGSAGNNNGSAFAGLSANSDFYNIALGFAMLIGRLLPIAMVLGLAGSLARQGVRPDDSGTLPTYRPQFVTDARRGCAAGGRADLPARPGSRTHRGRPAMTTPVLDPALTGSPRTGRERQRVGAGVFNPASLISALPNALRALDPRVMAHNPVMFVVEVGAVLSTVLCFVEPGVFVIAVTAWLWLTVLFANLADAVAEGRGKAQADSLRAGRDTAVARRTRRRRAGIPGAGGRPAGRRPGGLRGGRRHPG